MDEIYYFNGLFSQSEEVEVAQDEVTHVVLIINN
jgi:hypothetical protein